MKTRIWLFALALAALAALAGCETVQTTQGGVVGIDRKQSMSPLVSSAQMDQSAVQAYAQVLGDARKKNQLNQDPAQVARVRAIANRLIPSTAAFRTDAPGWKWEVNVVTTNEVNAWCMPGGKIAVYTGLIEKLSLTDDELAAVMGHEISHALREHARERMSRAMPANVLAEALGALYGQSASDISGFLMQAMFELPNSRQNEQEADRIGVELAARAGYDPNAALTLWNKMETIASGQSPGFLSDHPSNPDRMGNIERNIPNVQGLYDRAPKPDRRFGPPGAPTKANSNASSTPNSRGN